MTKATASFFTEKNSKESPDLLLDKSMQIFIQLVYT